jgi:hypothetical protein
MSSRLFLKNNNYTSDQIYNYNMYINYKQHRRKEKLEENNINLSMNNRNIPIGDIKLNTQINTQING